MKTVYFFLASLVLSTSAMALPNRDYDCVIKQSITGQVLAKGTFLMTENGQQYLETTLSTPAFGKAFIELRMGVDGTDFSNLDDVYLQLSVSNKATTGKNSSGALTKGKNSPKSMSVFYFSKQDQLSIMGECLSRN
jgi:hypothetical protein